MANINKNIIMQAGAAVANATNKAAGLSAATPEPGSIISAIQLVNGGRTIGPDSLAHFTESVRNKLLSLLVTMEPIQDFNGYEHPWPAGGGVNKLDPTTMVARNASAYGLTITISNDGIVNLAGTWTGSASVSVRAIDVSNAVRSYNVKSFEATGHISARWQSGEDVIVFDFSNMTNGNTYNFNVGIVIYEGSTAPTSWTPYSNICPISGRTGANAYVSPTPNVADASTYAADWTTPAGTVYAGSADIVTGDIKAAPYYASYNGETLVGPWVSSMDVYDPEGTPTTGAQVVDLGGAMTEYHITGQDIITLVGDNYIWSDSGNVTITE